jgi:hypothetical protein
MFMVPSMPAVALLGRLTQPAHQCSAGYGGGFVGCIQLLDAVFEVKVDRAFTEV